MSLTLNGSGGSPTVVATPPPKPREPASKEAHVSFKAADGVELRGSLGRMTRHSVVFEIYSPKTVLSASKVLAEFSINFQGKVIYFGRAVIRSVVEAGAKVICEVTLDEAQWLRVDSEMLKTPKSRVPKEFNNFLQEWQKFYIVSSEFKVAVADLQTFLHDLQLWLNQVELELQAASLNTQDVSENAVAWEIGKVTTPTLNRMFEKFELAARKIEPDSHAAHGAFAKHMLHQFLLCSPFLHRTFTKPLGYAGDYEMVNMLNRDPLEGDSLFAKIINLWFWEQPPAEAHRHRLVYLERCIEREAMRAARLNRPAQIFNFACGPSVEVQEFLKNSPLADNVRVTLADFNSETLEYVRQSFRKIKGFSNWERNFNFQKKSVHQLLKESEKITADNAKLNQKFDFVYCAGLFDYLSDRTCKELTDAFYNFVAPGGLLVLTNVDSSNPRQPTMDLIMEWHLIYRNSQDFLRLCPEGATNDDCSLIADTTGVNIYMEIRKPNHG